MERLSFVIFQILSVTQHFPQVVCPDKIMHTFISDWFAFLKPHTGMQAKVVISVAPIKCESRREKTGVLHMRKQRRRSASR